MTTEFDIFTTDDIARHPYYQEFLGPLGLRWYAAVKIAAGDDFWALSLQRSISQGPFSPAEVRQLAGLSERLGSVAAVARALAFARAEAALDAFGVSDTGALMLDGHGTVLAANPSAERLLGRDLQISKRRLTSVDRSATDVLDRALRSLLLQPTPSAMSPPVLLPRTKGRPLLAYPLRLPSVSFNALAPCQAIIVLIDPDVHPRPPGVALQAAFGLTAAEARLAREVSSGDGLQTVADRLGIAYETARTQLRAVLTKTETHRQASLVALLAKLGHGPRFASE